MHQHQHQFTFKTNLEVKIGNMENDNEENAIQKLPNFHMSFSYSFFLKSVRVKSVTLRQIK